jgi:malate dehydrogenase (quinone)
VSQVIQKHESRMEVLRDFVPTAEADDWELIIAGQRVQTMKQTEGKRGAIVFGTELVCAGDGTIAGLLGASPGASTAVSIMLDVLRRCFPAEFTAWLPRLREVIPSVDVSLSENPALLDEVRRHFRGVLELETEPAVASL